ncbi:MAG: type II toxin-antitoxin system RelB/DinJ family antitoxin [Lachnospiraceae bacterium]|uniref:type II toxin-antitoxin system RelB/DinJ family antitoxin n=1 Tax=uncultured Bacteroides sp. TaxID=162156 RepID=UPI0032202F51
MGQMVEIILEIDADLKEQAEVVFAEYGLTLEQAAILFFKEVVRLKQFPFELDDDLLEYTQHTQFMEGTGNDQTGV